MVGGNSFRALWLASKVSRYLFYVYVVNTFTKTEFWQSVALKTASTTGHSSSQYKNQHSGQWPFTQQMLHTHFSTRLKINSTSEQMQYDKVHKHSNDRKPMDIIFIHIKRSFLKTYWVYLQYNKMSWLTEMDRLTADKFTQNRTDVHWIQHVSNTAAANWKQQV